MLKRKRGYRKLLEIMKKNMEEFDKKVQERVNLALLCKDVGNIKATVNSILGRLNNEYLTKMEYSKDQQVVDGRLKFIEKILALVGTFLLLAFLGAVVYGLAQIPR